MKTIIVKDLMTPNPVLIDPDATLQEAAESMKSVDCGMLPVGVKDNLEGVITDRDIIIRALAEGKSSAQAKVRDFMTVKVYACNENDTLDAAADKMRTHKVGRLVVKDNSGKVTGVLSFGGILRKEADAMEISNVVKHATRVSPF
ncbi:MAG: CBS domain-containing protein [Micavibrio sp.]